MSLLSWILRKHIKKINRDTVLFTPGPASLTYENLISLAPVFGRGDSKYQNLEYEVLNWLMDLSGQTEIVRLQGSATLAIEIALENFVTGKVLLFQTGFYSNRILEILGHRADIQIATLAPHEVIPSGETFDWVIGCPTETSTGYFTPITFLQDLATTTRAKLFLDATASIGLEENHGLADVVCFSSCKGLFGLTGAAFIAFSTKASRVPVHFSLNLETYREKRTTGPYHAIQSLSKMIGSHQEIRKSVIINKQKMVSINKSNLVYPIENQPKLCTAIKSEVASISSNVILYESRLPQSFRIICHLGEAHLAGNAKGEILQRLEFRS
jgi:aspartate aminotransferase-like enzyme